MKANKNYIYKLYIIQSKNISARVKNPVTLSLSEPDVYTDFRDSLIHLGKLLY